MIQRWIQIGKRNGKRNGKVTDLTRVIGQLVATVAEEPIKRATKYVSTNLVIKATNVHSRESKSRQIVVSIGPPNVREQEFIKQCKTVGEPFPVRKVQIKPER